MRNGAQRSHYFYYCYTLHSLFTVTHRERQTDRGGGSTRRLNNPCSCLRNVTSSPPPPTPTPPHPRPFRFCLVWRWGDGQVKQLVSQAGKLRANPIDYRPETDQRGQCVRLSQTNHCKLRIKPRQCHSSGVFGSNPESNKPQTLVPFLCCLRVETLETFLLLVSFGRTQETVYTALVPLGQTLGIVHSSALVSGSHSADWYLVQTLYPLWCLGQTLQTGIWFRLYLLWCRGQTMQTALESVPDSVDCFGVCVKPCRLLWCLWANP